MFTVDSSFIGIFKLGDNIVHNLEVLSLLYEQQVSSTHEQNSHLCKPIILLNASICEAILYDFHFRINKFTREGVQNIDEDVVEYIRDKHIDEFEKYISSARKHDLFEASDSDFYQELDDLRKLRNRIHIQNTKNHFEPDDAEAFNMDRQQTSERILEKLAKTMALKYRRKDSVPKCVEDFKFPWCEHTKEKGLTKVSS